MLKPLNRRTAEKKFPETITILQFGGGNFLRGFANWIFDVLNEKTNFNAGVEIIQSDRNGTASLINKQEGLYHLITKGIQNGNLVNEKRLITCVKRAINPQVNYKEFLKCGENPFLTFIVSNTTEAGLTFDHTDYSLNSSHNSFPARLTALLYHRHKHFEGSDDKGLYILPCELIEDNGKVLKNLVQKYIDLWGINSEFISWLDKNVHFCDTLVDRIVPGYPFDIVSEFHEETGYMDELLVTAEPYYLWLIKGPRNLKKKLPAEKSGLQVKLVDDLKPYHLRKVRILNGAHTCLLPVAFIAGCRTVRESLENEKACSFLKDVLFNEIIPTLNSKVVDPEDFAKKVLERFKNPFIHHQLSSIALNSIPKFKTRLLPTLLEYVQKNKKLPNGMVYSLAALIVFYRGIWNGEKTPVKDEIDVVNFFKQAWESNDHESLVKDVLSNKNLWELDLTTVGGLESEITKHVKQILAQEKSFTQPLVEE
jgi:tagaturonate reductase